MIVNDVSFCCEMFTDFKATIICFILLVIYFKMNTYWTEAT